jgi:hypothetical protein
VNMPSIPRLNAEKLPRFEGYYSSSVVRTERRGIFRTLVPIHRVRLNSDWPLALVARDGRMYRPQMCFESDGGSIPAWAQRFNVRRDTFLRAFFLHDNACDQRGLLIWDGELWRHLTMTRAQVDTLFLEALEADGAGWLVRGIIYYAVRCYAKLCVDW